MEEGSGHGALLWAGRHGACGPYKLVVESLVTSSSVKHILITIFLVKNPCVDQCQHGGSNFNNVDLLRGMLADCCMPRHREWGTMAAVGGWRPSW
jgi:hypothetical protein